MSARSQVEEDPWPTNSQRRTDRDSTRLTDFIDRVIVPALVEEYFAQARKLPVEKAELDPKNSGKRQSLLAKRSDWEV